MARTRITARAAREALDDLVTALETRHRQIGEGFWSDPLRQIEEYRMARRWRVAAETALAGRDRGRTRTVVECVAMGFRNLRDRTAEAALWGVLYDEG